MASDTQPRTVKEHEHLWIEMSDGARLAARVWMPADAEAEPVPAILEYLPYRRRDGTRERDTRNHPWFAEHGYASVRVDMRGTGDATGVLEDEYLPLEQQDGLEILRWIAAQPWCDGNVGMVGISWGGFNGLQMAALAPPELKAIITICSTDDRYEDDIHYMGGCNLVENFVWASSMLSNDALPPDPATVGDGWREAWLERLNGAGFWLEEWLAHQRRDDFWKHGSVCEDYGAIQCPVFTIGGWADGYTRAVFRLLENLEVPRLGLVGPWSHTHPNTGDPGPAVGYLTEALRFWDQWLKGIDTGIMDEPMVRAWMQEPAPPAAQYEHRPGRWVGEETWPGPGVTPVRYALASGALKRSEGGDTGDAVGEDPLRIRSPMGVGQEAGRWFPYATEPDLPGRQEAADGASLTFDTPPLTERLEILGAPELELEIESDQPVAQLAVRLLDVDEGGVATRVTYGLLNLTHHDGHEAPTPLEPGRTYRVRVDLKHVAQAFPAGHRIRLALSSDYWPLSWPSPRPATLGVHAAASSLQLPVRAPRAADEQVAVAMPADGAPPLGATQLTPAANERRVVRDVANDGAVHEVVRDTGTVRIEEIDLETRFHSLERYANDGDDPGTAHAEMTQVATMRRGAWETRISAYTRLTSDEEAFHSYAELEAYEGETRVASRTWRRSIARDHV
ncbi:MAG: CocE/NonD family hydrolase [Trueperaceae bacterium]|nr:CocE/NonD family hydrolase [Trueperaceae bacterium]